MALSDLELLELVERAQDERQGPIGPQGVGIRSIEQPTADAVIIALTDGRTKELRLTAGPKGDPGEAGKPGQDGKCKAELVRWEHTGCISVRFNGEKMHFKHFQENVHTLYTMYSVFFTVLL